MTISYGYMEDYPYVKVQMEKNVYIVTLISYDFHLTKSSHMYMPRKHGYG